MSKEIRELEESSKRIIENMRPQTIAQYHIKQWLDNNFIMGCARLEYTGKDTAKVMDTVGGVMYVEYKSEIEKQEAKGRKRNVQINIRISEAEAEQLRKKVEQSGMSQQEYILSCVLNKPITNTDGIKELVPELKRVGNNLNQIAHALNGGRYYQYNLITDNQKELDKVWQLLKQYLQKQA